jgi:hypothetical protein
MVEFLLGELTHLRIGLVRQQEAGIFDLALHVAVRLIRLDERFEVALFTHILL